MENKTYYLTYVVGERGVGKTTLLAHFATEYMIPPRFFREIIDDTVLDYKAKMVILNKNTKFVTRELMKDFKLLRRDQRKQQAEQRRRRKRETLIYVAPAALIHS